MAGPALGWCWGCWPARSDPGHPRRVWHGIRTAGSLGMASTLWVGCLLREHWYAGSTALRYRSLLGTGIVLGVWPRGPGLLPTLWGPGADPEDDCPAVGGPQCSAPGARSGTSAADSGSGLASFAALARARHALWVREAGPWHAGSGCSHRSPSGPNSVRRPSPLILIGWGAKAVGRVCSESLSGRRRGPQKGHGQRL